MAASRDYNRFVQLVNAQTDSADVDCVMRVLELIFVRDGHFTLDNLSRNDIDELISFLVTE